MAFFKQFAFRRTSRRRDQQTRRQLGFHVERHLRLENLEHRVLLSVSPTELATSTLAHPVHQSHALHGSQAGAESDWSSGPVGYSPRQIANAYGVTSLITAGEDGSGQTIAIVDPFDDPNIFTDLDGFDTQPIPYSNGPAPTYLQAYGPASSFLSKVELRDAHGNLPAPDVAAAEEISLDVEWAHAVAPAARILLVETPTSGGSDLLNGVDYARFYPGVSTVSMSWGFSEFSSENSFDYHFTTPAGHSPITFIAATGDSGAPASWPAYSPNVVAAGGTTLNIDSNGTYLSETGWAHSGGGISAYELQPSYQQGKVSQSTTYRTAPDVSFDSDPNTGVTIYDSYTGGASTPWEQVGGTSLSAPVWASLIGVADQQRAIHGLVALDGPSQTLPTLYQLSATDLHDIIGGNNGYPAGSGYDLVTGRGTPIANLLVPSFVPSLNPSSAQFGSGTQVAVVGEPGNSNVEDLFAIASDGLVQENRITISTHSGGGQVVIDNSTVFSSGANITAYTDGVSTNLFVVGKDGYVKWGQQTAAGQATTFTTLSTQFTFVPGQSLALQSQSGILELFAVGTDGYVKQFQYIASTHTWYAYGFSHNLQFNAGTPLAIWYNSSNGQIFLYGELPNGDIGQWFASSGWAAGELYVPNALFPIPQNGAPGIPLAVSQLNPWIDIFGVNRDGNIGQVQWSWGNGWSTGAVIPAAGAHLAVGTAISVYENTSGLAQIFGIDTNGNVGEVGYAPGWGWGAGEIIRDNQTAFSPATQVTFYTAPSGAMQFLGIGTNGHMLDEEYLYPAWHEYDLG